MLQRMPVLPCAACFKYHCGVKVPPRLVDEEERLAALHRLQLLDTPPDPFLDSITKAASAICETPVAVVSLIDAARQWFKSRVGLQATETPRDISFCGHAIHGSEILEVVDATKDPRFHDNPLVANAPHVRFYAGVPLEVNGGHRVGTLCVIDSLPKQLTEVQRAALKHLAEAVEHKLAAVRAEQQMYESTPAEIFCVTIEGVFVSASTRWLAKLGFSWSEVAGKNLLDLVAERDRAAVIVAFDEKLRTKSRLALRLTLLGKGGTLFQVELSGCVETRSGKDARIFFVSQDISKLIAVEQQLDRQYAHLDVLNRATNSALMALNFQSDTVTFSAAATDILGGEASELVDLPRDKFRAKVHPDDMQEGWTRMGVHLAGESALFDHDMRFRREDGRWVWIHVRGSVAERDTEGQPLTLLAAIYDATERKAHEAELERQRGFLDRTGRAAGVGGWEVDLRTSEIIWSDETCRIHGVPLNYHPDLAEGISFYAPEARPIIQSAVEHAVATGEGWDLELPFIKASGERIWVRAVGSAVSENGEVVKLVGAFQDITERRRLVQELDESHELMRITLASIGDAVFTADPDGKIAWLNPVAERITGWSNAEAQGRNADEVFRLVHQDSRAPAPSPVARCLAEGRTVGLARRSLLLNKVDEEFAVEDSTSPIRGRDGAIRGTVTVFYDVTEQRRLSDEVAWRADFDTLTELANRHHFERELEVLTTQVEQGPHCLLYMDLDRFKLVNDSCGHFAGDMLLREVAALLRQTTRKTDLAARLGGDEFAVLLKSCARDQAQRVAESICDAMRKYRFTFEDRVFSVGASVGIAEVPATSTGAQWALRAADSAAYAAKREGGNRPRFWDSNDVVALREVKHPDMVAHVRRALDDDGLELFVQEIVPAPPSGSARKRLEVLVRMRLPDGSLLYPGSFIPSAEAHYLAPDLDMAVLRKVLASLDSDPRLCRFDGIGVNLSGSSVSDPRFIAAVTKLLEAAEPKLRSLLCLEITETMAVTNIGLATNFVKTLGSMGVCVALDDFGAGATSFRYLKVLPASFLKIDGGFIQGIVNDPVDQQCVRTFCSVAQSVGMQTVAECVETPEQLSKLRELGIDYAQGYLLHQPQPMMQYLDSLAEREAVAAAAS